jgi:uncharacterized protein (TIGR03067 family)
MRTIVFISILLLGLDCTSSKNTTMQANKLNGTWAPVQQEMGGNAIPKAGFEKQRLIIKDSTYQFSAESVDKGIVQYNGDKMDIYGKEGVNTGKHFTAIYKYENGQLTICYNLKGDSYPEAFETKGHPLFFLCVFQKESGGASEK